MCKTIKQIEPAHAVAGGSGTKDDKEKLSMSLLPFEALEQVSAVLEYGAKKYAPDNWRYVKDAKRRYIDALLRHISKMLQGEVIDTESGFTHAAHAACNALFITVFEGPACAAAGRDGNDCEACKVQLHTKLDVNN